MSRNYIVFYKSFYDSAQSLGDKARLKLYDSILEVGFSCYENATELEQNCSKVETKLARFRNVFAQFTLIKPHLINNGKRYINGKNGGAPIGNSNAKKQPKNKQGKGKGKEEYKKEIYKEKQNYFQIPSIEEIKNYCLERNNNINPNQFYDYYSSKGWMIGKNKMKDWKAAIRTWEQNEKKNNYTVTNNKEEIDGWSLL